MTVAQVGLVGFLADRIREKHQIGMGLAVMGWSLALLAIVHAPFLIVSLVGSLALGMSFVTPNIAALISKRGGIGHAGVALGARNAANSLGQASGPVLGGILFIWRMSSPYWFSGSLMIGVALAVAWNATGALRAGSGKASA